jgi:LPXTG-motif cell wall-anchored protein
MENPLFLLLGLTFVLSSSAYLLFSKRRREVVLDRLRLRRRRASGANTPPRSLSPKKDRNDDSSETTDPDYKDVFPPSRRFTLAQVAPDIIVQFPQAEGSLLQSTPEKRPQCIPIDVPFDQADSKAMSPTEFSVEEIKALGDFPDYATLSGVPLPEPYENFNLEKALPRPYRPFRWQYHQTMCS